MFGLFLFVIVYGFLCWLVTPEPTTDAGSVRTRTHECDAGISRNRATPQETDVSEKALGEVDTLTLRQARKVASRLGIKQKVNGKDQPKSWLLAQIKKALEEKPKETALIITEIACAA